jgi:hypothetical protein
MLYDFVKKHGGWDNFEMVLIETQKCDGSLEAQRIKRTFVEQFNAILNGPIRPLPDDKNEQSKQTENEQQSKQTEEGTQSKQPEEGNQSKQPEHGKQSKQPEEGNQSKQPEHGKQSKQPEHGKHMERIKQAELSAKADEPRHSRALTSKEVEPPKQVKKMKVPNVLPPPIEGRTDTTEIPIERRHPGWEENAYQCSTCNCYINKFHINRHNNTFKHKKAVDNSMKSRLSQLADETSMNSRLSLTADETFSNTVENADDNENCIHNISSPE